MKKVVLAVVEALWRPTYRDLLCEAYTRLGSQVWRHVNCASVPSYEENPYMPKSQLPVYSYAQAPLLASKLMNHNNGFMYT